MEKKDVFSRWYLITMQKKCLFMTVSPVLSRMIPGVEFDPVTYRLMRNRTRDNFAKIVQEIEEKEGKDFDQMLTFSVMKALDFFCTLYMNSWRSLKETFWELYLETVFMCLHATLYLIARRVQNITVHITPEQKEAMCAIHRYLFEMVERRMAKRKDFEWEAYINSF